MRRGIEKESLRARPDGTLATTPHPAALGSALTHPHITTDFSEAQLELITGVHASVEACLEELTLHPPVRLPRADAGDATRSCGARACRASCRPTTTIPIGRYGTSNVGRAKTVYRMGLAHRYGRRMQTISGIHYNLSLPDVLERGVLRADPQLPAHRVAAALPVRRLARGVLELRRRDASTAAASRAGHAATCRYATSLRMGRLGYQSDAQSSLSVSYNSLAELRRVAARTR